MQTLPSVGKHRGFERLKQGAVYLFELVPGKSAIVFLDGVWNEACHPATGILSVSLLRDVILP